MFYNKDYEEEAELVEVHTHTCFVLLASSAGLLDRLAPATLLLIAGRSS